MRRQMHYYLAFLNENSQIKMHVALLFYDILVFFGLQFHFQTQNVQQLTSISSYAQKLLIQFALLTESTTQLTIVYLLFILLLNFVPYILIYFVKRFARRPPSLFVKMLISAVALICFVLYATQDTFYLYQVFAQAKQHFLAKEYINVTFLVLFGLIYMWFAVKYRQSLNQFSLNNDCILQPKIYVFLQAIKFVVVGASSFFQEVQLLSETLIVIGLLCLLSYIVGTKQLRFLRTYRWVECVTLASFAMLIFESAIQIFCLLMRRYLATDLIRLGVYLVLAFLAGLFSFWKSENYIDIVPEARSVIKGKYKFYTSLSKEFVLQLCAYNGPEFYSRYLEGKYTDFSRYEIKYDEVTDEDCSNLAKLIGQCEQTLESFKLLYEKIYGNIFLNYALCGQTLEHISLLDIEEALPIPLLLHYLRRWKSPQDAYISIIYFLKQQLQMDRMKDIDKGKYQLVSALWPACQPKRRYTIYDILQEQCINQESFNRSINLQEQLQAFLDNKEKDSVNPDLDLFQTNYEVPSDYKFAGELVILSDEDFAACPYLLRHLAPGNCENDKIFVLLPTVCSISATTGNLHRLCFNNNMVASKTQQLRRIRVYSLISLARAMFPLAYKIDGKFRMPLVTPFIFLQYKASCSSKYMYYSPPFILDSNPQKVKRYRSKALYQFAPYLIGDKTDSFVDSQTLQFILVEYLLTRQVVTCEASPRLYKFFYAFYGQQPQFIHKLMAFQDQQYDEKEVCSIPDDVVVNALAIQFSSALIDDRASSFKYVVERLVANRQMFASRHTNCFFKNWIRFNIGKYRMYLTEQYNDSSDYFMVESLLKYLEEFDFYMDFIDRIEQDVQEKHLSLIGEVAKFLSKYKCQYFGIMYLYSSKLCQDLPYYLIPDHTCQSEFDNDEYPNEVYLPSLTLVHQTVVETNKYLKRYLSKYNSVKLSNHLYYLQLGMKHLLVKQHKEFSQLRREGIIINNSLLGIQSFIDFITADLQTVNSRANEYSYISSSSLSSSFSQDTDYSSNNGSASYLNTDINLNNPRKFEDDFSLINNNYYNIDVDNILLFNHQPDQNTPEFLINVMKHDFKGLKIFNLRYFQFLMHYLTNLHCIKMHDQSIRAKNYIFYILPRICNIQNEVENSIQKFLLYIYGAKNAESREVNTIQLEYAISSINVIENQISKLFAANSLLLNRQYISDDQLQIIKEDVSRSIALTYGYPQNLIAENSYSRENLVLLCDTYSGNNEKLYGAVRNISDELNRAGGEYAYNQSFEYKTHKSWADGIFASEKSKKAKDAYKSYFQQKRENIFCFSSMLLISLMILAGAVTIQFFGYSSVVLMQTYSQRLSQAIFGVSNIIDDIGVSNQRKNFNSVENSTFFMLNFNKFRQVQEQLLIAHINTNAMAKRESFYTEYLLEKDNKSAIGLYISYEDFHKNQYNNPYRSDSGSALNEQFFTDLKKLRLSSAMARQVIFHTFQYRDSTIFFNVTSYYILKDIYTPIVIFGSQFKKKFAGQKFDIPTLGGLKQMTLLQALEYYIQQLNLLNYEGGMMMHHYSDRKFAELYSAAEGIKLSFSQTFMPLFNAVFEVVLYQQECLIALIRQMYVLFVIVFLLAFASRHFKILIIPLINADMDRGSIISSILNLPLRLLQAIHDKYRKATQLTNAKQCLFSVRRQVNSKVETESASTNLEQIYSFKKAFKFYNALFQRRKISWFAISVVFVQVLRILTTLVLLLCLSPNFYFNSLNIYNSIPDVGVGNVLKPFITQQLDLFGTDFKYFYELDNRQMIELSKREGLPPITYLRSKLDNEFSMPQITHDLLFIGKFKSLYDTDSQDCKFFRPYFEMLRIYNAIRLLSFKDVSYDQQEYKYLESILRLSCSQFSDTLACTLLEDGSMSSEEFPGVIQLVEQYLYDISKNNARLYIVLLTCAGFLLQLAMMVLCFVFVALDINHHKFLRKQEANQIGYLKNIAQIMYPNLESYFLYLLALAATILFAVSFVFNVYFFSVVGANSPKWLYMWQRADKILFFWLLCFLFLAIHSMKYILKAYQILKALGYPQHERQITVSETLVFENILYQIEDKNEIQHPTCECTTDGYIFPYPYHSYKHYCVELLGLVVIVLFGVLLVVSALFTIGEKPLVNEFSVLAKYQSNMNQISALTSKYYTHTQDRCNNCGIIYNLQNKQRDTYNYIRNSFALYNSVHTQFVKDQYYLNPTFYQFSELIQDQRFYNGQISGINKANYNFEEIAEPSLLYGVTNVSRFLQLKPPRDRRFGIHLYAAPSMYPLKSTVIGTLYYESLKQQIAYNTFSYDLTEVAKSMNPGGTFGPIDMEMSIQQQYVYQYARERQNDVWNINQANNREISRIVAESIDKRLSAAQITFLIVVCLQVALFAVCLLVYRSLQSFILRYTQKQIVFTALLLKRLRGTRGFAVK